MHIDVQTVNAFIDGTTGGNSAGVVVDANALTAAQILKIAHCGHATIATFSLLRHLGIVGEGHLSKETIDGNRDIVYAG